MVKNSTFSKCLVTPSLGSGGQMWSLDFSSQSCWVTACWILCFDCAFFFCSIINVVDNSQQWPWVPYQHTPSSLFSSHSGGNNKDVLASPFTVCSKNGCFISYMLVFTWRLFSKYAVAVSFIGSLICGNTVCTEESAYVILNVSLHTGLAFG